MVVMLSTIVKEREQCSFTDTSGYSNKALQQLSHTSVNHTFQIHYLNVQPLSARMWNSLSQKYISINLLRFHENLS